MSGHPGWVTAATGIVVLLLSGSAGAETRANAIVDSWFAMDTAQNRQRARARPIEATAPRAPDEATPAIQPGKYPLLPPRVSGEKRIYSKLPSIPHFFFKDVRGPATLAITEHGPAVRYHKGHVGKRVNFSFQVVRKIDERGYTALKPLAPRWLPRKLGRRVAKWRAQRMMRQAVRAGRAPTPAAVKQALVRAR